MIRTHEFEKLHKDEDFYVFTDAQKMINGCIIGKGCLRINPYNRGITNHQLIPFWSIQNILFESTPKLIYFSIYNKCFLRKWHYAFPAKLCINSEIEIIDNNYYTDGIELGEPMLIEDLSIWKNKEITKRAIIKCGFHAYYVTDPDKETIMMAIDSCPQTICFVKNQTLDMWERVSNNKFLSINLYKYIRIDDPNIYRLPIANQFQRISNIINSDYGEKAIDMVKKTSGNLIRQIITQAPEKYKKMLYKKGRNSGTHS